MRATLEAIEDVEHSPDSPESPPERHADDADLGNAGKDGNVFPAAGQATPLPEAPTTVPLGEVGYERSFEVLSEGGANS
jgi:hypothetical protein